jgi:hypothetical protein
MDLLMTEKATIEHMVEIIKSYFSIAGLISLGVYLVKNVATAPFHWHAANYVSGGLAIGLGSVIGIWYAFHNFKKYHTFARGTSYGTASSIIVGAIMVLTLLMMMSLVIGAVAMSCESI